MSSKFFGLKGTFCLCLLHFSLRITWFFFKQWHCWSSSGVTWHQLERELCKHFLPKYLPQNSLEQELFWLFFYGTENQLKHFSPAELFFALNEHWSFLLSANMNKAYYILTQILWVFQWDLKVFMIHLINWRRSSGFGNKIIKSSKNLVEANQISDNLNTKF